MRFRILGPLEITADGDRLPLGGPKQRLVLAHLLIRANEVVSADLLIDEIWGEEPPDAARSSLHSYVSHLRKALGPDRLIGRTPGYVLRASAEEIDAVRFETLVRQARRRSPADPTSAARALREALGLWQGEPLADLSTESSLQAEIERLSEMRLGALEDRIEADLALGQHGELVVELERLVGRHPLRERLYGQLMIALYRAGRQAEALTAYHQLRSALDRDLGIDPSPALEDLQRRILTHDPTLEARGEPLRGYRLVEQIGSGPLGVVHRAVEPQTERDVAIKVFGARAANERRFVQRFDAEARRIARLEHPHVVPLYDWWREPDAAYLVMRLMSGGSLADRLAGGQASSVTALHWTEQIAAALDAAHRQGLVHGDIRPANVLFDADENAYLTDFTVGYDPAQDGSVGLSGTQLRHLAPERRTGGVPSAAADVYAFGVLLGDLLGGAALGQDGADLRSALERSTSASPAERHPTATDLAAAIRRALLAPTGTGAIADAAAGPPRNPYKGLRAFEEADAADYFGRAALIGQLVERLTEQGEASRLLAVVGPSGSGKSSVVHAGLIPALRAGAVPASDQWFVATMSPGNRPFEALERALFGMAVDAPASLSELLEADEGLRPAIERVLPPGAEMLLVIDQFEELFTLAQQEDRQRFLGAIARTVADRAARIRVIVTLRADFYDRPLRHEQFAHQLASRTHAVPPLTPEELERVISDPAERAGLRLEQGLVARIVAEVSEQPGGLPLLQYALSELWERRDGSRLSLRAYEASGGIGAAVGRRAEQLVGKLDAEGREAARQLFLRLVEPGEGTPDTSRRVRSSELQALGADRMGMDRDRMDAVIESFARYRLLLFDRDIDTREPTVELAHEALLGAWPRLRQWVDDAREDLRSQRRLAAAAAQWVEGGRDPSFLLTGSRLDQTGDWAASTSILLAPSDREFLAASAAEQERQEADEAERRAREIVLERRAVSRLRALVLVLGLGAVLAGGLSLFAFAESQRAGREARVATARELAAAAVANLEIDPERSILLALEAIEGTRTVDGSVLREAEEALHRGVVASRVVLTVRGEGGWLDWAEAPDGTSVFVTEGAEESGVVSVRDAATGDVIDSWQAHDMDVNDVTFSRDGSMLATTGDDGALRIWQTMTGAKVAEVPGEGQVWGASFGPGDVLVAAAWPVDGVVRLVDLETGTVRETPQAAGSLGTSFSPDGTRLATSFGDPWAAGVLDVASLEPAMTLDGGHEAVDIHFSPDGTWIAAAIGDQTARIWEAETGALRFTLAGHSGEVVTVAWSPDSTRLLTGSRDGTARLWQITDEGSLAVLSFSSQDLPAGVNGVTFSPDGNRVMTGDFTNGAVKIWDIGLQGDAEWINLPAEPLGQYGALAFMPDGLLAASSGADSVTFWDVATGTARFTTTRPLNSPVAAIEPSPGGELIATGGFDGMRVWDPTTEEGFPLGSGVYVAVAWSADGESLAAAHLAGEAISIFDRSGREVRRLVEEPGFGALGLSINREGWIAASERPLGRAAAPAHRVTIWDLDSGEVVRSIAAPELADAVAFDPSGTRLAGAFIPGRVEVWDLMSDEKVSLAGHAGGVRDVVFSPDGSRIATAGADATVRLWDATTGAAQLVLRGHKTVASAVRFSPDGSQLASLSEDGVVRVWALDLDDLIGIARNKLTRVLSDPECRQYLHLEACPGGA